MKKLKKEFKGSNLSLSICVVAVILFILTPYFFINGRQANAAGQITSRYIEMSSSADGSTSDGQGVTYLVGFTFVSTDSVGSIEIEFCDNSPLIGDTCTDINAGEGFDTNHDGGLSLGSIGGTSGESFALDAGNSSETLICVDRTPEAVTLGSITLPFSGIDNPEDTNDTFYARIRTLTAADCGGTQVDYGGIALSTAEQLTITAKVQEQITFCIYVTGSDCAGGSGNSIGIGDSNDVLALYTQDYEDSAYFGLASNAQNGVNVRMKGTTLCKDTSGSNCTTEPHDDTLDTHGTSCFADSTTPTVEQFGLAVIEGSGISADATYNCTPTSTHALDMSTSCSSGEGNITCTYGDRIAYTSSAQVEAQSELQFSAKAAVTSAAGVYTAKMTFIATATY